MTAPPDVVVVGLGELGVLHAGAALKQGSRVTPVTRSSIPAVFPPGAPVLVAVGEDALLPALAKVPVAARQDVILLQNELFPNVWKAGSLEAPTVLVAWFSKKKGRPVEVARPSLTWGRHAALVEAWHQTLEIPCTTAGSEGELHTALVAKFSFILTINALGLKENLSLGAWLEKDASLVDRVVQDAQRLGEHLLGHVVDGAQVQAQVREAMNGLAHYPALGRTAAARLQRAASSGVDLPCLAAMLPNFFH